MKKGLLLFVLVFAQLSVAQSLDPQLPQDMSWSVISQVAVDNQFTVGEDSELVNSAAANELQIRTTMNATMLQILNPVLKALEDVQSGDASALAQNVIKAAAQLTAAAQKLKISYPKLALTINYVLTPWQNANGQIPNSLMESDKRFTDILRSAQNELQVAKYGVVESGKPTMFILGATASIKLSQDVSEAHLQILTSMNPRTVDGETSLLIPKPYRATESTVLFTDVSQPLDLKLPKIEVKFGKIGRLEQEGWLFHFLPLDKESLCSRDDSAATILQPEGPLTLELPIYRVAMDLNLPAPITDSDVRVKLPVFCLFRIPLVQKQFQAQANQQLIAAKEIVSKYFGVPLENLAEIAKQERAKAGLPEDPNGD